MDKRKKSYSAAEKRAYYIGYGMAIGFMKHGKKYKAMLNPVEQKSYGNGFDDYIFSMNKNKKKGR